MEEPEGSHRTRSRAAPGWTAEESLALVNEINDVESDWGAILPSFQKWQQIVQNCNAIDVNRSLNQCKRHWEALLSDYRRARRDAAAAASFPADLFRAIDRCVNSRVRKDGGGGGLDANEGEDAAEEEEEGKEDYQVVMETDPDSDPEEHGRVAKFVFETGSRKQKRRMKRQKCRNPWGYFTSTEIKHDEASSINDNEGNTNTVVSNVPKGSIAAAEEQTMATILQENARLINTILEGKLTDGVDYILADLRNTEAIQTNFTRRQGNELIDCLGKISATLNQLCDLAQNCK